MLIKSFIKNNLILIIINKSLIKLPTPININIWWNFGSLLGIILLIQIIRGLFLSIHYCANTMLSFNNIIHIIQNVNNGWFFRLIHINGASFFFIFIYIHIGRGLYYKSFIIIKPWMIGVIIFILSIATAFIGYVLPWGQISFWGATVITNLISTIPYIGQLIVEWIWGRFSVRNPTLNRFYSFHFIMPFIILIIVIIHLLFIHELGSRNPLGINRKLNIITFNIYFTLKDIYGFIITLLIFNIIILLNPYILSDPENFIIANSIITPIHIQPEWYFLFAYTILRTIPNKLGGVLGLIISIIILFILPLLTFNKFQSSKFYPINKFIYWNFINIIIILTWLGAKPIEVPFIYLRQLITLIYFLFYFTNNIIINKWDLLIF